jgi:hypothetical protein
MSRPRFAPVTSSLLERKGHARPLDIGARTFEFSHAAERFAEPALLEREDEERIQAEYEKWMREQETPPAAGGHAHRGPADETPRRCTIRLTHAEYERLGIVAVKREITRQQALRQAVERYLATAKRQYRAHCTCLGGTCNGSC